MWGWCCRICHHPIAQVYWLRSKGFGPAGAAQLVLQSSGYGFQIRNDNAYTYMLLTNNGNPSGTFNGLRPFYINNSTGSVGIDGTGAGIWTGGHLATSGAIDATGNVTANSGRVRASYGATSSGDWNACTILDDFHWGSGWQKMPSGIIFQWGLASPSGVWVNFPIAFPTGCWSVIASNADTQGLGVDNAFANNAGASSFYIGCKSTGGYVTTYPCYWFAIGS